MFEIWDILRPLTKFALYLAMFLAAGGLVFEVLFRRQMPEQTQRFVSLLVAIAAWAGLVLVGARLAVAGIGFAMITVINKVKARGELSARIVAAATLLLSLTVVGHATMFGAITGVLLALHLGGVAFWLGALLPLRQMCGATGDVNSAAVLAEIADRFGRIAQHVVPVLIVAGMTYAALLLGSVVALVTTGYGLVLLVKILLVAGLLGLAARNRFRIVPALQAGDLSAAMRLRRTIDLEILLALSILLMSSLLTTSLTLPNGEMG